MFFDGVGYKLKKQIIVFFTAVKLYSAFQLMLSSLTYVCTGFVFGCLHLPAGLRSESELQNGHWFQLAVVWAPCTVLFCLRNISAECQYLGYYT